MMPLLIPAYFRVTDLHQLYMVSVDQQQVAAGINQEHHHDSSCASNWTGDESTGSSSMSARTSRVSCWQQHRKLRKQQRQPAAANWGALRLL